MSKSYEKELMQVYTALVADIVYTYPTLERGLVEDLRRLQFAVNERGIHALCVDLPALGKHLDRCLDEGMWSQSGLPFSKPRRHQVLPVFLGGLMDQIFDSVGRLMENADVQSVKFLRQVLYLAKRTELDCSAEAKTKQVEAFFRTDRTLPQPEEIWAKEHVRSCGLKVVYRGFSQSDILRERAAYQVWDEFAPPSNPGPFSGLWEERFANAISRRRQLLKSLDKVSAILVCTLGHFDPEEGKPKHGPGAISQSTDKPNKYHWYGWSEKLDSVFPFSDHGFHNHAEWADGYLDIEMLGGTYLPASRLIDVPKDFTKPRLIAAEPSEHQWCQQGIKRFLYSAVGDSWISNFVRFDDQTLNQRLCQSGSRDGRLATIDLSEASDRVTCHVVGQFFRNHLGLLKSLIATRTPRCTLGKSLNPKGAELSTTYELRKFATMGNACTFPVESLIFLGVAIAACLTTRQLPVTKRTILDLIGEVAVFGDDIIVPSDCRESLLLLLDLLWFRVNEGKSYGADSFRESCGVDSFRGHDVTPVYWKQPLQRDCPESIASTVDTRNLFYKNWYLNTAARLEQTIPPGKVPVVRVGSGVMGLESRTVQGRDGLITRWNEALQRLEVRSWALISSVRRIRPHDASGLHQYFTEDPHPTTMWKAGTDQRPESYMEFRWVPFEDLHSNKMG